MTDIVERLRLFVPHCEDPNDYLEDELLFLKAADEIERLREALRYYAKNHYPDIDAGPWGPNSNDWGDVARAALGGEE